MNRKRKLIKALTAGAVIFALLLAVIVIVIPENAYYTYENSRIVTHSARDTFEVICTVAFFAGGVWFIGLTAAQAALMARERTRLFDIIMAAVGEIAAGCLFEVIISFAGVTSVGGMFPKDSLSPECYLFSDGRHTVVIEETSFYFSGWAEIYQLTDDGRAVSIGKLSCDDSGRNFGKYEIKWSDREVKITYDSFYRTDRIRSVTIPFI